MVRLGGAVLGSLLAAGCGDKCEVLCQNVGSRAATCKPASFSWADLGARNRADFVSQCRDQWDRERIDLSSSDLRLALEACADTSREVASLSCDEFVALYGPAD